MKIDERLLAQIEQAAKSVKMTPEEWLDEAIRRQLSVDGPHGEPERTFLEACLAGKAKPEDIEAWIARWDEGPREQDLTAFLGLSISVYHEWINDPPSLARNIESLRELRGKHGVGPQ